MELSDQDPDVRNLSTKTSKPLMEKKRRDRINRSLHEMKLMLVKNTSIRRRHSKWEKADILEMTVAYIKQLQAQQRIADPSHYLPYIDGYSECVKEVQRFNAATSASNELIQHNYRLYRHLIVSLVSLKQEASWIGNNKRAFQRFSPSNQNPRNLQMPSSAATSINSNTTSSITDFLLENVLHNLHRRRKTPSNLINNNQVVPLPPTLLLPNKFIDASPPNAATTSASTVTTEHTALAISTRLTETSVLPTAYSCQGRLPLSLIVQPHLINNINLLTLRSLPNQNLWRPFQ